jgi:hypothetical protein
VSTIALGSPLSKVKARLRSLSANDQKTRLLDGVAAALDMARAQPQGQSTIVVLSDGKDEGSKMDLLACLERAETQKTPIQTVGYSRIEKKYLSALKALSRASGGAYHAASDGTTLSKALTTIFEAAVPSAEGGRYFVLDTTNVRGSFPNMKRPHDYFVGTYLDQGRNLVLFYVGVKFDLSRALNQGHVYERVGYGER